MEDWWGSESLILKNQNALCFVRVYIKSFNRPNLIGPIKIQALGSKLGPGLFKLKPIFLFDAKKRESEGQGLHINLTLRNQCWI